MDREIGPFKDKWSGSSVLNTINIYTSVSQDGRSVHRRQPAATAQGAPRVGDGATRDDARAGSGRAGPGAVPTRPAVGLSKKEHGDRIERGSDGEKQVGNIANRWNKGWRGRETAVAG